MELRNTVGNKSIYSNATSHDNTFNFGNQLDISNGKKDKTGEMFFNFQDFNNIGDDKTVKSSNYKARNTSNILKRENDQFSNQLIGNSILDNQQEFNNTGFNTRGLIQGGSKKKVYFQKQVVPSNIPKFGDRKSSGQSNHDRSREIVGGSGYNTKEGFSNDAYKYASNMHSSDLSYTKSNIEPSYSNIAQNPPASNNMSNINNFNNNGLLQVDSNILPQRQQQIVNFVKKTYAEQATTSPQQQLFNKQMQYKQLLSMINYYKNEAQKMAYERMLLQQESIKQIVTMTQSQTYEEQIKNNLYLINSLNSQIDKERAIQKRLTGVVSQLQDEYNQIIESVNQMDFRRPPVIKDQAKVLIDQINQLKNQFEALQRDNGTLNLSCTLFANTPNSIQNRGKQSRSNQFNFKQAQIQQQTSATSRYLQSLLQQIHQQNSHSQDPQLLKNLKLACIKQQWTIFSNKQLIISVDYKSCPVVRLHIGNKTNKLLSKFTISAQIKNIQVKLMENQILNKKSFLEQGIKIQPENLVQIFIKMLVSYQIQQQSDLTKQMKSIKFFCPTGILNFGEFTPLTFKEFQTQLNLPLPIIESAFKPIDKSLIGSLDEIMFYFPNLRKWENQDSKIFGLFMNVFHEGTLIIIEGDFDLLNIKLKNGSKPLLKLMEFILTV